MPESFDRMMARMMTIGTVGTVMVTPIGLGLLVDYYVGTMPLFMVIGALAGLLIGIIQLVRLNKPGRL